MNKLRWAAIIAALVMGTCGCSLRYGPTPDQDFDGIAGEAARARIVRVFVIHGMGDHLPGYSAALAQSLAVRTGLAQVGASDDRTIRYRGTGATAGNLRVSRFLKQGLGAEFRIYELTWSPLTIPLKNRYLDQDREPQYQWSRAPVNKAMKEGLIDRAFSDAILYVGDFGDAMRWITSQGICHALNDRHSGGGDCSMSGVDVPGLEADQIVFISSSLGSRMLFDSLLQLMGRADSQAAIEQALAKTNLVFMLANQVALLGLGNVREPEGAAPADTRGAFGAAPPRETGIAALAGSWSLVQRERARIMQLPQDAVRRPLRFIAFSDPNDLLSFRLGKDAAAGRKDVEIINVMVSNVPEVLGLLARPDKAHTSYGENPGVLNLMVCGSKNLKPACD